MTDEMLLCEAAIRCEARVNDTVEELESAADDATEDEIEEMEDEPSGDAAPCVVNGMAEHVPLVLREARLALIRAEKNLAIARDDAADLKAQAKDVIDKATASKNMALKYLFDLLDGQNLLPGLTCDGSGDTAPLREDATRGDAGIGDSNPQLDDDSWRAVRIAEFADYTFDGRTRKKLPPRILKALAEHEPPIETLGDMTDWQKQKSDFWAKDIKGLGPKAADELSAACEDFFEKRKTQLAETELENRFND